jgi:hypothetical protein
MKMKQVNDDSSKKGGRSQPNSIQSFVIYQAQYLDKKE